MEELRSELGLSQQRCSSLAAELSARDKELIAIKVDAAQSREKLRLKTDEVGNGVCMRM